MDKIKVIDDQIAAEYKKIKRIEEDIKNLEKKKQIHQVRNGEAYFCASCKNFQLESTANSDMIKYQLCYNCNTKRKQEEHRKCIAEGLLNAVIVDIKATEWGQIEELFLKTRDEKIISVCPSYDRDDGDAWLKYAETNISGDRYPTIISEITRPGLKPRKEKSLPAFSPHAPGDCA